MPLSPLPGTRIDRRAAIAAAALMLLAGVGLVLWNESTYRAQRLRDLDIQAQTLAESIVAPLMFADFSAAQENTNALSTNPDIEAVGVYDDAGRMTATFQKPESTALPATSPETQSSGIRDGFFESSALVQRDGQTYGAVFLRARGEPLLLRLMRYAPVALLFLMAALALVLIGAAQIALTRANHELHARAEDLSQTNSRLEAEIAQRREAEEALVQSRKMEAIGQLTGGVAHDFNNLLMVVSGGLRMLVRHQDEERRGKAMTAMRQAVERGAGLTRQLLAFSRRQTLEYKTIDAEQQINGMRDLLERSLRADIILEIAIPNGLPPVRTDPGQMELAILNLAVNARDAMPKGGVLTISAERNGANTCVDIIVHDTGMGIPPEIRDRIFEPYFTTKQIGQGTGLGLSQVYGLAQQSGGAVRIESQIDAGTSVILSLPVSAETVTTPKAPTLPANNGQPRKILVVEDEDEVAGAVLAMLDELGHRSLRANSVDDAIALLRRQGPFDFVFSDIVMPGGKSGVDLARELATLAPELPVLLTTGYSGGVDTDLNWPLLRKPYEIDALRDAIAALPIPPAASHH
jgi:signal transduction histidine kinase